MNTFDNVLKRNKGFGPGFDFLRIFLAVNIVIFHSQILTGNVSIRDTPFWFLEYALVPMFFALSGFLVTASGLRLSLWNFLINRSLRIAPALAVDICLCALVIGPLVTTANLRDYFSDNEFWSYFLNITGYIHYELPGVFETHIDQKVNGALWTVPYEILCYTITSFLISVKWLHDPKKVVALTAAMVVTGMGIEYSGWLPRLHWSIRDILIFLLISRESQIVTAFLCGVIAYQLRARIPYHRGLFLLSLAICVTAAFIFDSSDIEKVAPRIVLLPALIYITVFIGLTRIKLPDYFKKGDYSYGVYLYHDPLLQLVISLFPAICAVKFYGGVFTFFAGMPFVLLLANFSWHFIEKPVLSLRKKFSFVARARGVDA